MNSGVIIKVEYRLLGDANFNDLDVVPESGTLAEPVERTAAGMLHKITSTFKIARTSIETETLLKAIKNRKAQFRITDANKSVHLVGDADYPARLTNYQKAVDGNPGSFNGYRCTVSCDTPNGSYIS